jgi:hypothetical protein
LTGASAAVVQARVEASASAIFPWGRWEKFRPLRHVHTVVDRSVSRSCASESRGKRVSIFPIGAMGIFEDERAQDELCWSRSGSSRWTLCLHKQQHRRPANSKQNMSLPSGRWELFKVSVACTPCIVDRSVRSCASESRGKRVSNLPMGVMGTFQGLCGMHPLYC